MNLPRGSSPTQSIVPSWAARTVSPREAGMSRPWWPPSPYEPRGFSKPRRTEPCTGQVKPRIAALATGRGTSTRKGMKKRQSKANLIARPSRKTSRPPVRQTTGTRDCWEKCGEGQQCKYILHSSTSSVKCAATVDDRRDPVRYHSRPGQVSRQKKVLTHPEEITIILGNGGRPPAP